MKKARKHFKNILIRYLILILIAIPNLWIFYFVFTPLTIYPVYVLLGLFFEPFLSGVTITIADCFNIEIIGACVSGAGYYLLLILNLSTPKIKFNKRMKMIFLSFGCFLILNIARIFFLSIAYINGYSWFDFTHKLFWYLGSSIFVVGIWFAEVKLFKIKQIPFYSDLKFLYGHSNLKK